jgi:hypothetical protein
MAAKVGEGAVDGAAKAGAEKARAAVRISGLIIRKAYSLRAQTKAK